MKLNVSFIKFICIMLSIQPLIAMEGSQPARHRGPRVYDLKKMAALSGFVSSQIAPSVAQSMSATSSSYAAQPELPAMVSVCACVTCFICVAGSACGCCSSSHS